MEIIKSNSELILAIATAFLALFTLVGGIFVGLQLLLLNRQAKYQALSDLHDQVLSDGMRKGLQSIYSLDPGATELSKDKDERDRMEQVLDIYDLLGFRFRQGVLPRDETLETEWSVVLRIWHHVHIFVIEERIRRKNATYYKKNLEELAQKAEKYRCKKGFTDPRKGFCKPCVAVLVKDKNNKLLLGTRKNEPAKGKWDILGGFMQPGESAEDAAVREISEETKLKIYPPTYLGSLPDVFDKMNFPTINFCFVAEIQSGKAEARDDVKDLQWFDKDSLPGDMAFPHQYKAFELYREWIDKQQKPLNS